MNAIKNFINAILYGNNITLALRIFTGLLFLYSGIFKAFDLDNFGKIIMMYDILPENLVPYTAIIVPFLELLIGLLLVIGFRIRAASFVTIMLMFLFMIFITVNIIRGNTFDCGCFELSQFGIKEEIGIPLLIRDVIIVGMIAIVFYAKKQVLSLDNLMEKYFLEDI